MDWIDASRTPPVQFIQNNNNIISAIYYPVLYPIQVVLMLVLLLFVFVIIIVVILLILLLLLLLLLISLPDPDWIARLSQMGI